ncbi:MAG: RecQ family ATP-dependent DNA helicase [Patescibacteria group bacterium]
MSNIKCPKCDADMVLRTARRGRNAGNQFWGCSNYPRCKHTMDAGGDDGGGEEIISYQANGDNRTIINIPRPLSARESFDNTQVRFYESLAVPSEVMEEISCENLEKEKLSFYGKWRLDYPINKDATIDNEAKLILLVANKILTRGRVTLLSPNLENSIKSHFKSVKFNFDEFNYQSYLGLNNSSNETGIRFDGKSGNEKTFYEDILPSILGPYYKKFVIPQVHFSSFSDSGNNSTNDQRVDFLITTPNKKVIVEIDDVSHSSHTSRDDDRDLMFSNLGYEIVRISNEEINNKAGNNIDDLKGVLKDERIDELEKLTVQNRYLISTKLSHQLQVIIVELLLSGLLNPNKKSSVIFDSNSINLTDKDVKTIISCAIEDLKELIYNLTELYNFKIELDNIKIVSGKSNSKGDILITFDDNVKSKIPTVTVQEISFSEQISQFNRPTSNKVLNNIKEKNLEYFLEYIFRHKKFREGQYEAISRSLSGKDSIILLPTGAGKSVAYQLTSLLLPGVAIVIDPIIALINNQLFNLEKIGIDRTVGITSQITNKNIKKKIIQAFGQGEYNMCYVAPERFQTNEFRNALETLRNYSPVSLLAIDEAHCVSEWGHDFRTSYLNIGRISREYCTSGSHTPPLLALTGTASNSVLKDVKRELKISDFDAIITPKTFDRKELSYSVSECTSNNKFSILKSLLDRDLPERFNNSRSSFYKINKNNTNSGIIFCPHVGGNFGVVENATQISNELGIDVKYYSGGSPKKWGNYEEWNKYKNETEKAFINNKFPLLVATKSFGMGIDKPNIRYTVHYGIPNSIESFYQEAGRAGRDQKKSEGVIIISNDNKERTSKLLSPDTSIDDINNIMENERSWEDDDDITRAIFFHAKAFKGVENELKDIEEVLNEIGTLDIEKKVTFTLQNAERNAIEKGLHRLIVLGVVSDYTIDYSSNEFRVGIKKINYNNIIDTFAQYVAGYNKGRVAIEVQKLRNELNKKSSESERIKLLSACRVLISFIYDTIERGRRRALKEMLNAAEATIGEDANKVLRERILRYLESTYSDEIEDIINNPEDFSKIKDLVEGVENIESGETVGGIRSPKDAKEVRGQTARYLESTPDHPGLLFLRAISEMYNSDYNKEVVLQNLMAGIDFSFNRYNMDTREVYNRVIWVLKELFDSRKKLYDDIALNIMSELNDDHLYRMMMEDETINDEMLYIPSVMVFSKISKEVKNTFKN